VLKSMAKDATARGLCRTLAGCPASPAAEQGCRIAHQAAEQGCHIAPKAAEQGCNIAPKAAEQGCHIAPKAAEQGCHIAQEAEANNTKVESFNGISLGASNRGASSEGTADSDESSEGTADSDESSEESADMEPLIHHVEALTLQSGAQQGACTRLEESSVDAGAMQSTSSKKTVEVHQQQNEQPRARLGPAADSSESDESSDDDSSSSEAASPEAKRLEAVNCAVRSLDHELQRTVNEQSPTTPREKLDINTITEQQLMQIPKVGKAKAKVIMEYLNRHQLNNIEELKNAKGVGSAIMIEICGRCYVPDC